MFLPETFSLPILLYAETHFRFFRFFPSLLFRKFPEVIFDAPRRLDPGRDLPVVLLLNDIDRFPAECFSVDITVSRKPHAPRLFRFDDIAKNKLVHPFEFQSAVYLFSIPRRDLDQGTIFINCAATIKRRGKTVKIINDNLLGSSKFPFSCFIADQHLPGHSLCSHGDVHVHSHYSQSHVEFGPPIAVIDLFANCYGNDFSAITDHSYDLACSLENYLKTDKELKRWESLKNVLLNKTFKTVLVLGEEISCLNSKGKAIHMCGLGLQDFISGTLDGARRNIQRDQQLPLETAIAQVHSQHGIAFAAHPGSKMGIMQRIFLKRGIWLQKDFCSAIDGIQAINNGFGQSWIRSKRLWINELLKGHKLSLLAGNDSHGDFNRYRYLLIPFLSIGELFQRFFSCSMTGIYTKITSRGDVISSIKNGKTFVTSGPFLNMAFWDEPNQSIISKEEISLGNKDISSLLISNYEFGLPYCMRVYYGDIKQGKEIKIFSKYFNDKNYSINEKIALPKFAYQGYLRAEAECKKEDGSLTFSATSPCYFYK